MASSTPEKWELDNFLSAIISSVQFSCSVMSNSLWPHGLQHARPPCPLPTPRAYSNSCPLSQWCHPTISSFVVLFSSHLQSFLASGFFPMSQFFASGGQSEELTHWKRPLCWERLKAEREGDNIGWAYYNTLKLIVSLFTAHFIVYASISVLLLDCKLIKDQIIS